MTQRLEITRTMPLLDIEIDRSGDGRTVTAYAATFGNAYEVSDMHGHYDEVINAAAFNRTIRNGAVRSANVLFNHGRTIYGTPSERYSMPIGTPVDIKADARGLLTVTRYAKTPLGDEVLELIRDGAIKGQSFRGPIIRNARPRRGDNGRDVIERMELGLAEYGPAPFPLNVGAEMVAVRSQLLAEVGEMSPEERRELAALLAETPVLGDDTHTATGDGTGDGTAPAPVVPPVVPPAVGPSIELLELANANRRRRIS